ALSTSNHAMPSIPVCLSSYPFFIKHLSTSLFHSLSLHDALPIFTSGCLSKSWIDLSTGRICLEGSLLDHSTFAGVPCFISKRGRSEEHTSELQSRFDLVCRLLL